MKKENDSKSPDLNLLKQVLNMTFERNLLVLKEKFPQLYNRFYNYTPKEYALEMDPNGFINIAHKGGFMYHDDPKKLCNIQYVEYKVAPIKSVYSAKPIDPKEAPVHFEHLDFVNDLVLKADDLISKEASNKYDPPESFPVLLVLGTGLGYHLELLQKEDINHIHLYEPNNDLFYASLFIIDYGQLISTFEQPGKGISIEVGSSPDQFVENLHHLFSQIGQFRTGAMPVFCHYNDEVSDRALKQFFDSSTHFYAGFGFFEDEILSYNHTVQNLINKANLLPENFKMGDALDKPIFICGNGPSLDANIKFLKQAQDTCYIFCCGSAIYPLYKAGIVPDVHFEVERTEDVAGWIKLIDDPEFFKKVPIVAMNNVAPEVISLFSDAYLFLKPSDSGSDFLNSLDTKNYSGLMTLFGSNPLVGNGGLAFSTKVGFKNIHLVGLDVGYRDVKYHHSKDSAYYTEFDGKFATDRIGVKEVPANFGGTVFTETVYDHSRHVLEWVLRRPEYRNLNCFNCSDGAKIEGSIPKRTEEIDLTKLSKKVNFNLLLSQNAINNDYDVKLINKTSIDNSKKLFLEIDDIFHNKFKKTKPNLHQLINIFAAQQNRILTIIKHENKFVGRILLCSLNHMHVIVIGKLYTMKTKSSRDEYMKISLSMMVDYFKKMKKLYQAEVLNKLD
ncbi:6-hydroxymethylpterin diphosphokinase MptE-like protein [Pseudoalteromonas denitrificans]|nr:6-hydroxymethylpterin diphosphokinase MptE-like protein [Pseudoalteromonas denitrificans]